MSAFSSFFFSFFVKRLKALNFFFFVLHLLPFIGDAQISYIHVESAD